MEVPKPSCPGEWTEPAEAGIALEKNGIVDHIDGEDEMVAETGECVQVAKGLPFPKLPSQSEIEQHNLTHLPYRSWCPFCVAGRRKNNPHLANQGKERTVPLFVSDYCFLRDDDDTETLSVLVGRMCPSQAVVAIPCEHKGSDPYAVHRLRAFLKSEGTSEFVFKSDQERSLRKLLEDTMTEAKKNGEIFSAVPEASAVGESQSNGRAESAVQYFEDQIRTLKAALESRLKTNSLIKHPSIR